MPENERDAGYRDWASIGLVANPFGPPTESTDPQWLRLVIHAATNRMHVAVENESRNGDRRPIIFEMPDDVPEYYYLAAENAYLGRTGADPTMSTLAANIGLDMMRLGRLRGTLTELAELVGAVEFDLAAAAYAVEALRQPDVTLESYEALEAVDLSALAEEFTTSPKAAADKYFGQPQYARLEDDLAADMVLREAYYRSTTLEPDPEETEETPEDVPGETDTVRVGEAQETEPAEANIVAVRDYVVEHVRAHLSPVIARALRAYIDNGFGALAQELKVTKAPKKTIAALLRFERYRYGTVVLMYDRFDPWDMLEEDARVTAIGGLSELRWIVTKDAVMALLLPKDRYPELEELFSSAARVDLSMRRAVELYNGQTAFDADLAQYWIDSASLSLPASIQVDDPLVRRIVEASKDDILLFAGMMAVALDDAVARGLATLDEQAIEVALLDPEADR